MPNRIPLDPVLPKEFDNTPNDARSKAQLDAWWDHPYGVTHTSGQIHVRCLNGGSGDRSSLLGIADSYEDACALAEAAQAKWVSRREEPIFKVIGDGTFALVRPAQRPDADEITIETFTSLEEAQKYMNR